MNCKVTSLFAKRGVEQKPYAPCPAFSLLFLDTLLLGVSGFLALLCLGDGITLKVPLLYFYPWWRRAGGTWGFT